MSKAPALDAIEPFTWCQAAIRWLRARADDLFDGYVGMIRESWTRRRDLTQQMETGVQRNEHLPKL